MAIGHAENGLLVVDVVRSRRPKFNPAEVTVEFCALLKGYGITRTIGDKFSGDWASNEFEKNGVGYERAEKTKSQLYIEAESKFNQGLVRLPNRDALVAQLKSLVRKARAGGQDSVDTDGGAPEDEANVIAGLVFLLARNEGGSGVAVGTPSHDVFPHGDEDGGPRMFVPRRVTSYPSTGVPNRPPRPREAEPSLPPSRIKRWDKIGD
jgi:hypothetical protein